MRVSAIQSRPFVSPAPAGSAARVERVVPVKAVQRHEEEGAIESQSQPKQAAYQLGDGLKDYRRITALNTAKPESVTNASESVSFTYQRSQFFA